MDQVAVLTSTVGEGPVLPLEGKVSAIDKDTTLPNDQEKVAVSKPDESFLHDDVSEHYPLGLVSLLCTIVYSRFGNGIATNQLMKMVAGLTSPGRPIANLYFSAWSHSVISQSLNLACDLKMGEYLKVSPRAMWLTQIYGTVLGAFINYVVMISVVSSHRDLLIDSNSGSSTWSPAYFQSLNTSATTWALADYLYNKNGQYFIVPLGLAIGAAAVILHRIFVIFVPRIGRVSTSNLNLPQFFAYAGYLGFNQTQSCVIFSILFAGFFTQYYLRNYRPHFFKNYSYLVTAAFDGGSLFVLFILSFAVFGAGGPSKPFPTWWGNPEGNVDHCPNIE